MSIYLRKRKISKGRLSLFLDIYDSETGKQYQEYLNMYLEPNSKEKNKEIMAIAKAILNRRILDSQAANTTYVPNHKKEFSLISYVGEKINKVRNNNTKEVYTSFFKYLTEFAKEKVSIKNVHVSFVNSFQTYLEEAGLKPNSIFIYFTCFKALLSKAVKEGLILKNPFDEIKIKKQETAKVYLNLEELQKLSKIDFDKSNSYFQEIKRAFLFACYTGLRISDLKALCWQDVQDNQIVKRQQKTKTYTYIPLHPQAIKYLGEPKTPKDLVFKIPSKACISQNMDKWKRLAKIDKEITFHTSRHTFATLSLTYGSNLHTVQSLLGHKSIATTQIYAKIVDEAKQKSISNLPNLD